jgi:Flp pilus assembly protein TadD
MADPNVLKFNIALEDFDASLLPRDAQQRGTTAFRNAVKAYLEADFSRLGGWTSVDVDDRTIEVSWTPGGQPPDPFAQIVEKLQRGEYSGAIMLMRLFLSDRPTDVNLLYNLGMALSDTGELDEALEYLQRAIALAPNFSNAKVALGVALQRQGKDSEALSILNATVRDDPANPWAQRNLGACLLKNENPKEAEKHLREATLLNPSDQQAMFGHAEALRKLGRTSEADEAYRKTINIDEYSKIAELAQNARRQIAEKSFKMRSGGSTRPDAVMYCLAAIDKFQELTSSEVQAVAYEIAMLGRKGLDTNDPTKKYKLRTLPGDFSGLQLVCLMYVAFKSIAPEMDVGFDLSKEYAAAQALHGKDHL